MGRKGGMYSRLVYSRSRCRVGRQDRYRRSHRLSQRIRFHRRKVKGNRIRYRKRSRRNGYRYQYRKVYRRRIRLLFKGIVGFEKAVGKQDIKGHRRMLLPERGAKDRRMQTCHGFGRRFYKDVDGLRKGRSRGGRRQIVCKTRRRGSADQSRRRYT